MAVDEANGTGRSVRDTDEDWVRIGAEEPYHGVLSQERFLTRNLTPTVLAEFWRSGEEEIQYLVGVAARHFGDFHARRALDFGCGVGRLTRAMAQVADTVVGLDISPGMLAQARRGAPDPLPAPRAPSAKFYRQLSGMIPCRAFEQARVLGRSLIIHAVVRPTLARGAPRHG